MSGPPASLVLAPDPASVRRARALVRSTCRDAGLHEDVTSSAELLVSEVVTNAFTHGRSEARLCVTADARRVLVEVGDDNSRRPRLSAPDPDALDGRGLSLLEALASRWGVRDDKVGKTVWFEVRAG